MYKYPLLLLFLLGKSFNSCLKDVSVKGLKEQEMFSRFELFAIFRDVSLLLSQYNSTKAVFLDKSKLVNSHSSHQRSTKAIFLLTSSVCNALPLQPISTNALFFDVF